MKHNTSSKQFFKLIKQSVLFWTVAFFSFAIFRFYGLDDDFETLNEQNYVYLNFSVPLLICTVIGLTLGILYGVIDFFHEKYLIKKYSLGLGIFINTTLHFIATIIILNSIIPIFSFFYPLKFDFNFGWLIAEKGFWALMWYIVLCSLVFSFLKIAIERFGSGVFMKILVGHYKNPKEEERIFMFLDLKDSTTIAEKLGHYKYSKFIQDAFYDLNKVIQDYNADIYQYVGDEAVLTWPYEKGVHNNNCLAVFFAFEAQRESKKSYYLKKYGIFPTFKAGLHGGTLMAAEVGFIKKELAYHGDVINTSARIQAECNKHRVSLLLSEKILNDLTKNVPSRFLGSILLKGKQHNVNIHSILKND